MILEFPTKDEFFNAANNYLNSSWDSVIGLLSQFQDIKENIKDSPHDFNSERYWNSANQTLTSAAALVQQAVEFYIKGRIVEVSPYLLITGSPQSWPKGSNKNNIEFSSFRTIDAQDLLKVHDTVCNNRFSDRFVERYGALRVVRNKVMHTVDKSLRVEPEFLLEYILFINDYFSEGQRWVDSGIEYLKNSPKSAIKYFKDDESGELDEPNGPEYFLGEFNAVINELTPSILKSYFNFDKNKISRHCPICLNKIKYSLHVWDDELRDLYAKSYQNIKNSDDYECCICLHKGAILSVACEEDGCEGKYSDSGSGICFTCFN
jgi:hypothetical protein